MLDYELLDCIATLDMIINISESNVGTPACVTACPLTSINNKLVVYTYTVSIVFDNEQ